MPQKIPQPIIDLYDAFTHGAIDRRSFLDRLAKLAGGGAAATALLPLLANDYARAAIVSETDDRLAVSTVKFDTGNLIDILEPERLSADGAPNAGVIPTRHLPFVTAYHARPKDVSIAPAIIVIHENRGLNPHIKDVARRIALEGFHAFAVDMLSPYGGTPDDEDRARTMIGKLNPEKTTAKLAAIVERLALVKTHQRQVGAVGFCWGGGMVNRVAAASPHLVAGVAYYGRQVPAEDAAKIQARMMLHYAGEDERINAGIADYEAALKSGGVDYRLFLYEGAQHAFNNDANEARYDKTAADLAWDRTISFFKETLQQK
ncbi:MAG: dienelactone hydrolase family protein [Parvularculaceae bacterium]|nr:dienelactone hydrolase family protein [Parvularculaceae bacterium]